LDDGTRIGAAQVLVAGGPWTPQFLDGLAPAPPISRTWGVTVQARLAHPPRHILEEGVVHTVNAAEGQTGSLFSLVTAGEVVTVGSTFLVDEPNPEDLAPMLLQRGSAFVPALAGAPVIAVRLCGRPQSADGRPFIGAVPGAEGLYVCVGHGPWGMSTGPASAAMAVDLMNGQDRVPPALRADRAVSA
ncbi:MAG: NAD(P)/FAD-dependent oxidoreductase, partial [Acidimicrobiales bacterium]